MYGLVLIFSLASGTSQNQVIGAYSTLEQCETASQSHPSRTECFLIEPGKGMTPAGPPNPAVTQS